MTRGTIVKGKEILNAFGRLKNKLKINMGIDLALPRNLLSFFLRRLLCNPKYGNKISMGSFGTFCDLL